MPTPKGLPKTGEEMKRVQDGTVELTLTELLVSEIHDMLIDQGFSQSDALILLRGSKVCHTRRTPTPVLDNVLTPEFVTWLVT